MPRTLTEKQKARLIEIFELYGDDFAQFVSDPDWYLGDVKDAGDRFDIGDRAYSCPAERQEREHVRHSYLSFCEISGWFDTAPVKQTVEA